MSSPAQQRKAQRRLDSPGRQTTMSAMQATTRRVSRSRKAAYAGQSLRAKNRDGVVYVRNKSTAPSLADVAGHLLGSVNGGVRKKTMNGYGKD